MESDKVRVLVLTNISAAGHINPIIGLGVELQKRNHEVIIATEPAWAGKFAKLGFKEEPLDTDQKKEPAFGPGGKFVELIQSIAPSFREDPRERLKNMTKNFPSFVEAIKNSNGRVAEIIEATRPNVILYDGFIWHPAILKTNVPIVQLMFSNPLGVLESDDLPPRTMGFSIYSDPSVWKSDKQKAIGLFKEVMVQYNEYLTSMGAPTTVNDSFGFICSNLNVYMYPKALAQDYLQRSSRAQHWMGIDHLLRPTDCNFKLPENFMSLPGRPVFLSMGSLGSADVDLMKTLISHLSGAKGRYKFIVAKGLLHEKYELEDNMWGEGYVPQLGVLPLVDLAIIHGGNNSFIETLYFGKPMIVIPLFADQPDNAQRAVDAKIGARFDPFRQSGEELLQLMDQVMQDSDILRNVKSISKQMQESKSVEEVIDKIEFVAKYPKMPNYLL